MSRQRSRPATESQASAASPEPSRGAAPKATAPPPGLPASPVSPATPVARWLLPGLLGVVTFLGLIFPLYDTDFWWHLRTGEWILEQGWVPQLDLYTFADSDRPWIDLHWGFQVLITLLHRVGGVSLVIVVKALVIAAAVLVAFRATGDGWPLARRVACWIPAMICIWGRGYERPEMLSQLFLAIWLWVAFRVEREPKWVWLLPVVQLVWVNCHALFVLGFVVAGCGVADWALRLVWGGRFGLQPLSAEKLVTLRTRALAGLLAMGAALINPYFEEGALFPLTLYQKFTNEQEFYSRLIGEFRQPKVFVRDYGLRAFGNPYFAAEGLVALLAIGSVVVQWWRTGRVHPFRLLLLGAFLHLAWEAARNTNIFALVATTIACANFAEAWLARSIEELSTQPQPVGGMVADKVTTPTGRASWGGLTRGELGVAGGLLAGGLLVVTGVWNRAAEGNKPFALGEARDWFIHDAARFAGREGMPQLAVVNHVGQAAVYAYHNGPERSVLMDGRLEVCSRKTFEMLYSVLGSMVAGRREWEGLFTSSGAELPVVILDTQTSRQPLQGMLRTPGWRLVYADRTAGVFLSEARADRLKLPAVDSQILFADPR